MKKISKREKTRLRAFTKKLCKHPTLFTGGPANFQNVSYFFDGYLFATEERLKSKLTVPFSSWLAIKLKAKFKNFPYSAYIMARYKSEEMQFKKLVELFEEFLNTGI